MSQKSEDSRIRSLVQYHYQRNRHLSVLHDPEDLFQDAWIDLKQTQAENGVDVQDSISPARKMRQAVGRAAERADLVLVAAEGGRPRRVAMAAGWVEFLSMSKTERQPLGRADWHIWQTVPSTFSL